MSTKLVSQSDLLINLDHEHLDQENYSSRLSKLQIEAEVFLSQKPFNKFRVNKTKRQLFEILKLINEKSKVSTDELPRTQYRLGQLGMKWGQIEQFLAIEKFKIDKKKEEKIYERPSLFTANIKGEYGLNDYLEKNFNLQMFNKVDAVINKVDICFILKKNVKKPKEHVNSQHKEFIFDFYMNKNVENRKQMQLHKKNFSFYKSPEILHEVFFSSNPLSTKEKLTIKQGLLVMDPKQRIYLESFEKYIQNKYIFQNSQPESRHDFPLTRLIKELSENTQNFDIQIMWNILHSHVEVCDIFYKENREIYEFLEDSKENPRILKQNSANSSLNGKNILNLFLSSQQTMQKELIKKSIELLEEEFYSSLPKHENFSLNFNAFKGIDHSTAASLNPILAYVEKQFLLSDFRKKSMNFIEIDEFNCPLWAIFYVLSRAGMGKTIVKIGKIYKGSLKIQEFLGFYEKYLFAQEKNEELKEEDKRQILDFLVKTHEKVDVFKYNLHNLLIKNCEIYCEELINQLNHYLWFNLKFCYFEDKVLKKQEINGKTMFLHEFQENYLSYSLGNNNRNILAELKMLFFILCYEEALTQLKNIEPYFNDFVHMLIVVKESGLIFDFTNERGRNLDLKDILYKYIRNFVNSKPIEAFYYLRILPIKDMASLISSCIVNNELLSFFFDYTTESELNRKKLSDLLGRNNFYTVILEIIKQIKSSNLEMSLKLFDLIKDYEKVLSLIIEYETQKILTIPKKSQQTISKEKLNSLQITINSLLSSYKACGKLNEFTELNQIITLLDYLVKIKLLLENNKYENRFEEALKKIKEWRLIPLRQEQYEDYRDFYILFKNNKCPSIYLELLIVVFNLLKDLGTQKRRHSISLTSQEEIKSLFSALFTFLHNFVKNIDLELAEEKEILKYLLDLAHNTSIIF